MKSVRLLGLWTKVTEVWGLLRRPAIIAANRALIRLLVVFCFSVTVVAQDDLSLEYKPVPLDVPGKRYVVRIAYAVPEDRQPRPEVIRNVRALLPWLQNWYADQMERHGYGRKTFQFETDPSTAPPIHLVQLPGPVVDYQTDAGVRDTKAHVAAWLKVVKATQAAGVPIGRHGQIWLVLTELHEQKADGSIITRINRGGPWSTNNHDGVGTAATTLLGMATESGMSNTQTYNGMTIPDVGQYPLRFGVTFGDYAGGNTLGGIISGEVSSMMHELSHAFGLKHNNLNDTNLAGNLMGVGYRGIRSEIYGRRYPGEAVNLSPASAALLNYCRQFNWAENVDDVQAPVLKSAIVASRLSGGMLTAQIEATDDKGLGHAFFLLDNDVVASAPMHGKQMKLELPAYRFRSGKTLQWSVRVYDTQGKWAGESGHVLVLPSSPHAPIPVIKTDSYVARVGQRITLDASDTRDPDSSRLQFEWDTDGDGKVDTKASSQPTYQIKFDTTGHHKVRVQVSDGQNKSMTPPIVITVK